MTTFMERTGAVDGIASNRPNLSVLDTEQQLRVFKALSSIIDFAYTFDSHCRFLYANQALLDLLGLTLDGIVGKTFLQLPYPHDLAVRLERQIQQVFKTGQKLVDETAYTNPAGMTGYYEYIFNPVFGDDGEVEIVAGSTREVTHRKLNEQTQGQLAAIVDSSEDAIVSKDLDGIVTSWNRAAERFYGYTAADMVGTSILRIIPVGLRHEESLILARIKNGERMDHYETTRLRKNGETIEVSLTVSPIRNSAGVVVGTSKIARDISGRKQMERMLMQAEKIATMGRMAATIAHEVNNPLESITNLIYLARVGAADKPEVMNYLTTAEREVERVSHITRQTLGYFRDTTAHGDVSCHTLIEEVLRVYHSKIQARNIVVDTVFDTVRPVHASKGELTQILSNVIANAIDAMPTGGKLYVRVSEQDAAHIKIRVEDEGIGIAPENLPRVFEPFFTTKGNLGTGIGLWVSKKLIEKHHGEIIVCSRDAQVRGTCICMSLPFAAEGSSGM